MLEARIKPKRKAKPGLKNRFAELFQPMPIGFTAYLPLEECAVRLESREKHRWWRSTKTYVTITPVDDVTYDFTIKRKRNKQGAVEAHGYLQACEGNSTVVTGEVITSSRVPLDVLWAFIGITWLVLIFHFVEFLLFFAVMGTIGFVVDVFAQMHHRHELAEIIETTLGY